MQPWCTYTNIDINEFVHLPRPNSIEKKATAAMNRMASTSILIANHLWRETTDMISVQLAPPTWW